MRVPDDAHRIEICDNGVGFDVDWALMDAAAHAGASACSGMIERVRLIGGDLQFDSRPGSTKLQVKLAHWRPGEAPIALAGTQTGGLITGRRRAPGSPVQNSTEVGFGSRAGAVR